MSAVLYNPSGADEKAVAFNVLREDEAGVIWCGTDRGLYRIEETDNRVRFDFIDLGGLTTSRYEGGVTAIVKDRRGALWIASEVSGLYRLLPGGRAERYTTEHWLPANGIASLLQDRAGNVWVGMRSLSGGFSRSERRREAGFCVTGMDASAASRRMTARRRIGSSPFI